MCESERVAQIVDEWNLSCDWRMMIGLRIWIGFYEII
jgi:hypothetical protein